MAKTSLGVSTPASRFFTPASDQSSVSHLKVTVQFATPKKDGSLQLTVFCGNVCFGVVIDDLPGRPEYKLGDRLLLEYPKGSNPMTANYSAIYHADQVSQTPLLNRSTPVSEISTTIVQTMSSLELVQIINELRPEGAAELRHDNFVTKIEKHPGIDAPKFLGTQKYGNNNTRKVYNLPKRECELMVMSESLEVQTRVYDRMTELEQKALQGARTDLPTSVLDQVGAVIQQQLTAMFQAELPRLVQGELAKQQMAVRCGVTAGQVWQLYKLDTLKNGPQKLSRLLTSFGCEIDGGGKSAQGGRTAKMFDPDKSDKAMKSGLLEHCQRYIRERTGQRQLFAVQQDK